MSRGYNFGAGPATLPESLLIEAQQELLDWQGLGMSVLEIGHRTPEFTELMQQAKLALIQLLNIPQDYQVLFMGGAARTQFAMIPLNLLNPKEQAAYLITGIWSDMAYAEAQKLKQAYCVSSNQDNGYTSIADQKTWHIKQDSGYFYYTPNETVNGIRVPFIPQTHGIPLIADMTSCLLSEPLDVSQFDLIFAGAQKNIANAGLTIVIIKTSLLNKIRDQAIPTMLDYRTFAQTDSLYATPPTFNCYLAYKMFQWIAKQGGIGVLYQRNCEKAQRLYNYIDASDFYQCRVEAHYRSLMNVCFVLAKPELEQPFLSQAKSRGILALQGHRTTGGLRASLYNAMPLEGVDYLIEFMQDFVKDQGV